MSDISASYLNSTGETIRFILEPWAEEFDIRAGSKLDLIVAPEGDVEAPIFEQTESALIFYAGSQTLVRVIVDGEDVSQGSAEITTPSGSSPFKLVKDLFRK